jgi:hypothetical protein
MLKQNLGDPPPPAPGGNEKYSEFAEMARNLIKLNFEKKILKFFEFLSTFFGNFGFFGGGVGKQFFGSTLVGGLRGGGNLGFVRAQTRLSEDPPWRAPKFQLYSNKYFCFSSGLVKNVFIFGYVIYESLIAMVIQL